MRLFYLAPVVIVLFLLIIPVCEASVTVRCTTPGGSPIEGAKVVSENDPVGDTTDANGNAYLVSDSQMGDHETLTITHPDYMTQRDVIGVVNADFSIRVTMQTTKLQYAPSYAFFVSLSVILCLLFVVGKKRDCS